MTYVNWDGRKLAYASVSLRPAIPSGRTMTVGAGGCYLREKHCRSNRA